VVRIKPRAKYESHEGHNMKVMHHNWVNDSKAMVFEGCHWLLEILIWPNDVTPRLQDLSIIEARFEETQNRKVMGNSMSFLKRLRIQNFDIGERSMKGQS
jgi:hypothetical protein